MKMYGKDKILGLSLVKTIMRQICLLKSDVRDYMTTCKCLIYNIGRFSSKFMVNQYV